ncbi:unnamed protein product, partial [Rhizoctonia solani]
RQRGDYYWRRAHRDEFDKAVEKWVKANKGKEPSFGLMQKISYDAFKEIPQAQQDKWDAMAKAALEEGKTSVLLSGSSERARFYGKWNKEIDVVLRRGDTRANIRFVGVLVHEKPDGTLKIERKFSDSLQAFSNNPAVTNLLRVFGEWVEQTG